MRRFAVLWLLAVGSACVDRAGLSQRCDDEHPCDDGRVCIDELCQVADPPRDDAGMPLRDGGDPERDAGAPEEDGGAPPPGDAGPVDAGLPDSGLPPLDFDAGFPLQGDPPTFTLPSPPDVDAGPLPTCGFEVTGAYALCRDDQDWETARRMCQAQGMDLVVIDDEVEALAVRALLSDPTWVGLRTARYPDLFEWVDGSPLTYHQLGNALGRENGCVRVPQDNGDWQVNSCGISREFLCEQTSPPTLPDTATCLDDPLLCPCSARVYDDALYLACPTPATRALANHVCETVGMATAPDDASTRAFLDAEAALLGASLWWGADDPDGDGAYRDSTGRLVYSGWAQNEPFPGECGVVHESGAATTEACNAEHGFVCRTPLPAPAPPPGDCATQGEYVVCTAPRSWGAGRALCFTQGMDLAVADNEAENDTLTALLPGASGWIGLSNRETPGVFRAVNGSVPSWSGWAIESWEPNGTEGMCSQLSGQGEWRDRFCTDSEIAIICESPPGLGAPLDAPACPGAGCPCFVDVVGGRALALCTSRLAQAQVEPACAALGMNPIASLNDEEAAALRKRARAYDAPSVWTGAMRDESGTLRYRDGSPIGTVPWGDGEPNGDECTRMFDPFRMAWQDTGCGNSSSYVCTADLPVEPGCTDGDGDGFGAGCSLGPDCDDGDPLKNPLAPDICNGVDDDCAGVDDDPIACPCTEASGYLFCDDGADFDEARARCELYGGRDLAVVVSTGELDAIYAASPLPSTSSPWVGLSRVDDVSPWLWVDGSTLATALWAPNEPGNDDCATLNRDGLGLEDNWCVVNEDFICE